MSPRNEASKATDNIASQAHCGQGDSSETAAVTGLLLLCPVSGTGRGGSRSWDRSPLRPLFSETSEQSVPSLQHPTTSGNKPPHRGCHYLGPQHLVGVWGVSGDFPTHPLSTTGTRDC